MSLKSGWCIDAVQALNMDDALAAHLYHEECKRRRYDNEQISRCDCECHSTAYDPTS